MGGWCIRNDYGQSRRHHVARGERGDPGTDHQLFASFFLASLLPSTLNISTSGSAFLLGGLGTIDYSIDINLPNGVYVTPLPAGLPLFATGLGAIGLLAWRRNSKLRLRRQAFSG